jgi:hypothetical protein
LGLGVGVGVGVGGGGVRAAPGDTLRSQQH